MTISRPSAEMLAAEDRVREIAGSLGGPPADPAAMRDFLRSAGAWWNEGGPATVTEQDIQVEADGHVLAARLYRPQGGEDGPVWIYCHGGGFRFGGIETNGRQLREIASLWGGNILSLDYPHLPGAAFPVAVETIAKAFEQLRRQGERIGVDGARMAWGGASAGASIAAGAAVEAEANGLRLAAGVLICPVVNGDLGTASMTSHGEGPWFPSRAMAAETWLAYTGTSDVGADPRCNLLKTDPRLLPPILIAAAEIDIFQSGAEALARHLSLSGQPVRHLVYPGVTHLFFNYSRTLSAARQCTADIARFLTEQLPVAKTADNLTKGERPWS